MAKESLLSEVGAAGDCRICLNQECPLGCCRSEESANAKEMRLQVQQSLEAIVPPRGAKSLLTDKHSLIMVSSKSEEEHLFVRVLSSRKNPFTAEFLHLLQVCDDPLRLQIDIKDLPKESELQQATMRHVACDMSHVTYHMCHDVGIKDARQNHVSRCAECDTPQVMCHIR